MPLLRPRPVASGTPTLPPTVEYTTNKGVANGYAGLDGTAHIDTALLPAGLEHTVNKNVANGYAGLNGAGLISGAVLPAGLEILANKGVANGYAGLDGTAHISLAALPATVELTTHKNVANGYPGLDSSGNMVGTLIVRYDLASAINLIVLAAGELAVTSDSREIRIGDGVVAGGISFNPNNSQQCLAISAAGTPAQNGLTLLNAYANAKARTPNGAAIGPDNRVTLMLFPGRYDIAAAGADLVLDTQYVNLIGIGGAANTRIICAPGSSLVPTNAGNVVYSANNVYVQGIEFKTNVGALAYIRCPMTGSVHQDLVYTMTTPDTVHVATGFQASGFTALNGTYRRITGNCGGLYGGIPDGSNCVVSAIFEDCTAVFTSFGAGDSDLTRLVAPGRWTRVHIGPQTGIAYGGNINMQVDGGLIEHSYIKNTVPFLVSGGGWPGAMHCGAGGQFFYNTIINTDTDAAAHAIDTDENDSIVTGFIAHNCLSAPGINAKITNSFGTLAASFNVQSAGLT